MASQAEQDFKLGFLTAIELPSGGYVGGLLVTNRFGRPLEFQCTTPVKANRTQEILYGKTLGPYLLGELIGKTLVDKASVKPDFLLADSLELLEVRLHISQPVATLDLNSAAESQPAESTKTGRKLRFHPSHIEDQQQWQRRAGSLPESADLSEPFERVKEALQETTRVGGGR